MIARNENSDWRICVIPDGHGKGVVASGKGICSSALIGAVVGLALAAFGGLALDIVAGLKVSALAFAVLTAALVLISTATFALRGSHVDLRREVGHPQGVAYLRRPRLMCFAYESDVPLFASVDGYAFEPVLVAGKFALLNARLSKAITRYGIELLLAMVCVTTMISATGHLWMWMAILLFAALLYLPVAIRPCYLRISPGLLEVLVGNWRHPKTRVEKSLSLNQLHVTIRLDTGVVDFRVNPADKKSVARLGLAAFANPAEVAAQIARGAVAPGTGAATAKHALCG